MQDRPRYQLRRFPPAMTVVGTALVVLVLSGCTAASPSATSSSGTNPTSDPSVLSSPTPDQTAVGLWTATGAMTEMRSGQTATLLHDGTVLVAGGGLASAELYDPAGGSWTATSGMNESRTYHTATLLDDGRVLVAGGHSGGSAVASAELYDPETGSWAPVGNMNGAREGHTAALLLDGRVLVAGGAVQGDSALAGPELLAGAELFDVASGTWTAAGEMTEARFGHTATLLQDGTVLVAGGGTSGGIGGGTCCQQLASAERFDPAGGSWTATGSMGVIRYGGQTATLLLDGKVLVAGGYGSIPDAVTNSAELYDPDSGTWTLTGTTIGAHANFTATLLPNGTVLVAGGGGGGGSLTAAEFYQPSDGSWTAAAGMIEGRSTHTATLLSDGRVLVAGGCCSSSGNMMVSAELFDPGSRN